MSMNFIHIFKYDTSAEQTFSGAGPSALVPTVGITVKTFSVNYIGSVHP